MIDLLRSWYGWLGPVVVEVQREWWLVCRVTPFVVQRGGLVGVDRRQRHAAGRVPVPERQRKLVVADELPKNPFVEVQVEPARVVQFVKLIKQRNDVQVQASFSTKVARY